MPIPKLGGKGRANAWRQGRREGFNSDYTDLRAEVRNQGGLKSWGHEDNSGTKCRDLKNLL